MNFIQSLTKQLSQWQDETTWLTPDVVRQMLIQAAAESLPLPLPAITLRRVVSPEPGLNTWTELDIGDGDRFILDAGDVATLRALLLSWDEARPAQVGDALLMPALSILMRDLLNTTEVTTWALIEELQRRARGEEKVGDVGGGRGVISERIRQLAMSSAIVYQTIVAYHQSLASDERFTWEQALEIMVVMLADENDNLYRQLRKCIDNLARLEASE